MLDVNLVQEHRTKNELTEKFDPSAYPRKSFGMYGGREELVTLECRERLAGIMIDRFGTEPTFHKTEFGFRFSVRVMVSPTFLAWVMGFGDEMKVIAPISVKENIRDLLIKTAAFYSEDV